MQELTVEPFRTYRVSCWMRVQDLDPIAAVQVQVRTAAGHILNNWNPTLDQSREWQRVVTGFNSFEYDRVRVYAGVWEGKRGKLWIDDLRIEEVGPINVLRREGTPVVVTAHKPSGAASGVIRYEEGRDFEPIQDPNIDFRFDHRDPLIRIPQGSRIAEGDLLRISYYQGMAINQYQVPVCIAEPEVYRLWRESLEMIRDTLRPSGYFLAMDELRAGGWCEACREDGLTAAQRLGRCVTKQVAMCGEIDPGADVFIWSDMLDPNHNAVDNYYMYRGDFTGSWNHVPKNLIIACWYYDRRKASLEHFQKLGFRTVAGAYYDADTLDNVEGWLSALKQTPAACGIIYTTWYNQYQLLEPFGDLVIGRQ
jgi:hypothetical protein